MLNTCNFWKYNMFGLVQVFKTKMLQLSENPKIYKHKNLKNKISIQKYSNIQK